MARDPTTGRLLPGESGNPGGRPGTDTARTLAGRRARRALLEVLEAVGPGLTVIVLDARGLVLDAGLGARRAGLDGPGGDLGDDSPSPPPDPELQAEIAAARARGRAQDAAEVALLAEGWGLVRRQVPPRDGHPAVEIVEAHGPAGQVLGYNAWVGLIEVRAGV